MDDPEQGPPPTQMPGRGEPSPAELDESSAAPGSAGPGAAGPGGAGPGAQPHAGLSGEPVEPAAGAKRAKPPRTRTGIAFQGFLLGAIVLALMLIFILENTEDVRINYLGAKGHLSLGVALLLAAVGGALLIAIVGAARISQLRWHARRQRRN